MGLVQTPSPKMYKVELRPRAATLGFYEALALHDTGLSFLVRLGLLLYLAESSMSRESLTEGRLHLRQLRRGKICPSSSKEHV
jgi:hypothetical protein